MTQSAWKTLVRPRLLWLETGLIVALCYLYAGSPPPGINEPHYLGKAKNYWDPSWCAGDFFFESADAHEVFYWTFGWITNYLSLTATAWCGRLIVWTLFALAWHSLVRKVTTVRWASLLSAVFLIPLIRFGHLSGEWLIAGVEAKGFAYPLVFWGVAKAVERRWWCVWPLLGLASSFHVVIGGWAVIACLIAWMMRRKEEGLRFDELIPWLFVGGALALPGLLPAINLAASATPEESAEANIIYSFRRLSHHLIFYRFAQWNPFRADFNVTRPASFAILVTAWWTMRRFTITTDRMRRLEAIVIGSLVIAAGGFLLDIALAPSNNLRASILRYYWFRLSDVFVPMGLSIALAAGMNLPQRTPKVIAFGAIILASLGIGFSMDEHGFAARSSALQQQNWRTILDGVDTQQVDEAWFDVCDWIRDPANTSPESTFLTPTRQQTFKWYAQRPDVVTWKDTPQDAIGLTHWWKRREAVYLLGRWPWQDREQFANITQQYGVTHVVWPDQGNRRPPENGEQIYRNDLFRVFKLNVREDEQQP